MLSIVAPVPADASTCGYCGPPGKRTTADTNQHAACLIAMQLSCEAYQKMIDRGWRRSGDYCYKPDMKRTCCPQYTIRLDASQFKTSKSQRKLINRFNRWILYGDDHEGTKQKPTKSTGTQQSVFSLEQGIHESEDDVCTQHGIEPAHKLEITLEPSSYTEEKFDLYKKYQRDIHKETGDKKPDSFTRFLVKSPLRSELIHYVSETEVSAHLPREYGSYHQLYRIDGELIAMGVIDILPNCVSSVYFMYDQQWERFSLGKLSALREISLVREMYAAGALAMGFLYMGYYIHSCPKMRYKGEYTPSYLADPEDYSWHPLEKCVPLLEKNRYACFVFPEHSIEGPCDDPRVSSKVSKALLDKTMFVKNISRQGEVTIAPITIWPDYKKKPRAKETIDALIHALGADVLEDTFFNMIYVL